MKLIAKGFAVVDKRWRIVSDQKGELVFARKEDALRAFIPDKEMVVDAEIYIPIGLEKELAVSASNDVMEN